MINRAAWLAGIALAAPLLPAAAAEPAAAASSFQPPEGPVLITRTVVRGLFDGKEVRAARSYLVWFRPDGDGWRLEGELRSVTVDVPPALEQFASLERNRTEPGFFPILLDPTGRIRPRTAPPLGDGARATAAAVGEMLIAGALTSSNARNQANTMLTQVIMAGNGGTAWPDDLFHPDRAESVQARDIALPDGSRGTIKIALHSEGRSAGSLPARFERTVTTELGGTRRTSREIWTFAVISP